MTDLAHSGAGAARKSARREVRLTERDNDLLIEAAGLAGMSVTEFVVEHAVADAEAMVHAHHTIELDGTSHATLIAALDDARPNRRFAAVLRKARPLKHSTQAG